MSAIIERSIGTVRYAFRDSNAILEKHKTQASQIILNFAYGKTRLRYSTGYQSCYADWDFKKQRIKNKAGIINKDEINTFLSDLENFIIKKYAALTLEYGQVPKDVLKRELDIFTKKAKPKGEKEYLSFFDVIQRMIDSKEGEISDITIRSYKQTKKRLQEFERHLGTNIMFSDVDMDFYNQFNRFLEKRGYALNTIGKHIKSFKTFLNYALTEGYTTNRKFKSRDFRVKKEITTEIYLTDEEIKLMHNKDLSKYPELEHARDVFLFGCYTGQRVSDYNGLKKRDIVTVEGVPCFKIRQKKNRRYGTVVFCPITKEMREIMDARYGGNPPDKILEQDLNENIKQVAQMLEWNEEIKCEYTKGGESKVEMVPKYKLVHSHTARRSYCTNKYKAGMSPIDIMFFSGHTTDKEFYKYLRMEKEERVGHIIKSGFFNV